MKKLNHKGFTLIELLAVIVILAVVMGVATTSVLSAMNNSRKSALQDSALAIADSFKNAYLGHQINPTGHYFVGDTEQKTNHMDSRFNTVLLQENGWQITDCGGKSPGGWYIDSLKEYSSGLNISIAGSNPQLASQDYIYYSAVQFDQKTSTFTVCLVANPKGKYYVANAAKKYVYNEDHTYCDNNTGPTITAYELTDNEKYMWACSDNRNSWTN